MVKVKKNAQTKPSGSSMFKPYRNTVQKQTSQNEKMQSKKNIIKNKETKPENVPRLSPKETRSKKNVGLIQVQVQNKDIPKQTNERQLRDQRGSKNFVLSKFKNEEKSKSNNTRQSKPNNDELSKPNNKPQPKPNNEQQSKSQNNLNNSKNKQKPKPNERQNQTRSITQNKKNEALDKKKSESAALAEAKSMRIKKQKADRLERTIVVSKRTRKGQPLMKDRINYLLKKIESSKF